jgi:hypothetical protein
MFIDLNALVQPGCFVNVVLVMLLSVVAIATMEDRRIKGYGLRPDDPRLKRMWRRNGRAILRARERRARLLRTLAIAAIHVSIATAWLTWPLTDFEKVCTTAFVLLMIVVIVDV